MKKYILSIDQGTTSTRAILFDNNGNKCFLAQHEVKCLYPHEGWVEQDAQEIWLSVINVCTEVCVSNNISIKEIDSFAITNQRETTIVWDKATGVPVYNAIVWQSRQTADICDRFADKKEFIQKKTGLIINPYFSASKLRFILDAIPNGQSRAEKGELMFGTVDSWLVYKLTDHKCHYTDVTNASRTMLFNIHSLKWDSELLKLFNIPKEILPEVKASSDNFGVVGSCGDGRVRITGVAGDQQAALFGQTCFEPGESKNTYGTGCFMLLNVGDKAPLSNNGLLTTVAWKIGNKVTYALEGSVFIGGAVIQWLRDGLKIIDNAAESENKARKSSNSDVVLVPAFVGLGTPYWDDDARGTIFGLTRGTTDNDIAKAALESIAFQCKDVFTVMKEDTGIDVKVLNVDGGATANKYLMQFQSNILETSIVLPECRETTCLGAAYLAGLYTGFFESKDQIRRIHKIECEYHPSMVRREVDSKYARWKKAVSVTREFK